MSVFGEIEMEIDGDNVICPYCKYSYQPEMGDLTEDNEPIDCDECGKRFHARMCITYDFRTEPDCGLNDEEHDYQMRHQRSGEEIAPFCTKCGQIQPIRERKEASNV